MAFLKNTFIQLASIVIVFSCAGKVQNNVDSEIYVPIEQTPILSEFVESIEYLALPSQISSGYFNKILVTEDHFIFADFDRLKKVYVLDKSLNLVSTISNYGEGPGEYQWIDAVNYNPDRKTIEIMTNKDLIRFSLDGKAIEYVSLPLIFGNLLSISKDEYLVYSKDVKKGMLEDDFTNDIFLIKWNSVTGKIDPVIIDYKEDVIGSMADDNNMFRYNGDVYASYAFSDTVYKVSANGKISRIHINLSDQNLPLDMLYGIQPSQILNREEIKEKYAYHYPGLMVNDHFFIDSFAKRNRRNFIIQNNRTSNVITGRKIVNDIDGAIEFLMPHFLDENDNIYTVYEYEEIWAVAQNSENKTSDFQDFVKSLSPETGFVLVKYHLKDF